jgi:ankyrin repeat protein
VAELLRLGADARRLNNRGQTALHQVARRNGNLEGGAEIVRLLVAAGCDAAVRDNYGLTAVEEARKTAFYRANDPVWGPMFERWVAAAMA